MAKVSKKQLKKRAAAEVAAGISFSRIFYEVESIRPKLPLDAYRKVTTIIGDLYKMRHWGQEEGVGLERRTFLDSVIATELVELLQNYVVVADMGSKHVLTDVSTSTPLFASATETNYEEEFNPLDDLNESLELLQSELDRHLSQDVSELRNQMAASAQSFRTHLTK